MVNTREHVSPDGLLRFIVVTQDNGDVELGFDGFAWHTHADILSAVARVSEAEAIEQFISDLLCNRLVIALSRVGNVVKDVWVTDNPVSETRYLSDGESVELRYWNGDAWSNT
jgi:hypothetical protein